jgi:hypothetical protein
MEEAVTAWKEARHVPMHCAIIARKLFDAWRLFGRRFVLRVVNEALNAQIAASDSSRPSKRRKHNRHSRDVVSSPSAYERGSGQSDAPAPSNERPKLDVDTSGDEVEQAMRSSSEPSTSKVAILSTGYHGLTSTIV